MSDNCHVGVTHRRCHDNHHEPSSERHQADKLWKISYDAIYPFTNFIARHDSWHYLRGFIRLLITRNGVLECNRNHKDKDNYDFSWTRMVNYILLYVTQTSSCSEYKLSVAKILNPPQSDLLERCLRPEPRWNITLVASHTQATFCAFSDNLFRKRTSANIAIQIQ